METNSANHGLVRTADRALGLDETLGQRSHRPDVRHGEEMKADSVQRLYGLMAGILLLRSFDNLTSSLTDVLTPVGDVGPRAVGVLPTVIVGVFCLAMGVIYARGLCRRWTHWTIMVLSILTTVAFGALVMHFMVEGMNVRGHDMQPALIARKSMNVVFGIATIVLAGLCLRSEKRPEPNHAVEPDAASRGMAT